MSNTLPDALPPEKQSYAQIVRQSLLPIKAVVTDEVYRETFIRVLALYTAAKAVRVDIAARSEGEAGRQYSGDLWIDADGTANFKFHIEGGDFTSARHALEKFIAGLQDKLNRAETCPYAERVLNHCKECGKDFLYSYEGDICPSCFGRLVGNEGRHA